MQDIEQLFILIDFKRDSLGYKAKVDMPCGLPSTVTLVDESPYPNTNTINNKYIKIKRSQTLKIPRFNNTDTLKCSLSDVIYFHNLKYYSFSHFEQLLKGFEQEINTEKSSNKERGLEGLTIVRSPQENEKLEYPSKAEEKPINKIIDINNYWINKKKTECDKSVLYQQRINECLKITDTLEKTRKFYWYYCLYKKEVPTVEEAIDEYLKQGLNTNNDLSSAKRITRFKSCRKFISARFDFKKMGINWSNWDSEKDKYIDQISKLITKTELYWKKGTKKLKLEIEELALIYYAIKKSNEYDRGNRDQIIVCRQIKWDSLVV